MCDKNLLKRTILVITIMFFVAAYLLFSLKTVIKSDPPTAGSKLLYSLAVCLILLIAFAFLRISRSVLRCSKRFVSCLPFSHATIIAMTILPRVALVCIVQVKPQSDFKTYHIVASALARGETVMENYISIFPHVIGYPYVLSYFYKLFGSHVLVAQLVNILFSCGIGVLIYHIGMEFMDSANAFMAAAVWALWPSQIFYTLLLVSETVYTFMVLTFMYLFLKAVKIEAVRFHSFIIYFLLGWVLSLCNAIRPFGLILLIACVIHYFIIFRPSLKGMKVKVPLFITMVLGYVLFSSIINTSINKKVGRNIAARPIGFNLYVGLNANYAGSWNGSDADEFGVLMQNTNYSAQDIHNIFLQKALSRLKENGKANIRLLLRKFSVNWCGDADSVIYISSASNHDEMSSDISKYIFALSNLCNFYYHAVLLLAATGCLVLIKKLSAGKQAKQGTKHLAVFLPIIYLWGIIFVHCIVEAAGRYHYPAIPVFSLLAAHAPYYMPGKENQPHNL